ncbi:hypothetical protein [Desulfobotulus mexicanus]|uniref:Uncharacterized protein n=1 Tax=Desulfobotulus mexicanus TaxID=2586642 RepID=A0A5Q4VEU2_9BACT|nr:hypothetical protein [Desulfobotulus mexicanus]TYT75488.1 hypothetical protein FIM25_05265 [Desulfobotulus mexicanus]
MKKMKVLLLNLLLAPVLILMAAPASHGATGTYIDCIHGCPDLIVCTSCCNQVFSSILATCNASRDQCEALCPPGNMDCLGSCMHARNNCLIKDIRDFSCPQWVEDSSKSGLGSGTGTDIFFKRNAPQSGMSIRSSECQSCHSR